jgi:hypothetical protein
MVVKVRSMRIGIIIVINKVIDVGDMWFVYQFFNIFWGEKN